MPKYRRIASVVALWACLFLAAASVSAQQTMAHMEACTEWDYFGGQMGTRNSCSKPIAILFMAFGDARVIAQDVPPGGHFNSGATEPDLANSWMFTACPVGYVPSLRFSTENATAILESLYNCQLPGRPGS